MRFKHKKLLISGTAVAAAGVLGAGALLQSVLSVQASSEMMPGIETIVNESTEEDPFRILELVDSSDDAEIGYYISGQEPSLKLYQYQYTDADGNTQTVHFSTIKDALSKLPEKRRTEFVMNVRLDDSGQIDESISTGIKKIRDAAGNDASQYPLSVSDYQEKYFLSDSDDASDWTKVDLTDFDGNSRTDTVTVNGSYVENTAGTGDYTKGDQEYYPIRNDVDADKKQSEKFRENIQSFEESTSSDARGAYYLEFTEVPNTKINNALADENDKGQKSLLPEYDYANGRYGYYENVYTTLTKEIAEQIDNKDYQFPGEKPNKVDESKAVLVRDILDEAVETTSTVSDNRGFDGENGQAATDTENFGTESSGNNDFSSGEDAFGSDGSDSYGSSDGGTSDSGEDSSEGITFDNSYENNENGSFSGDESGVDAQSFGGQPEVVQQSYVRTVELSDTDVFSGSDAFSDSESGISDDGPSSADVQSDSGEEWNEYSVPDTSDNVSVQDTDETGVDADAAFQSILGEVENPVKAGTQEDPYVYLGENIDQYPNYKYTVIGDLAYVKANATDLAKNPDAELTDGSIVLDNDEYWYYQEVNGKLTRSEISIVTGRSAVPYNEIQEISSELSYNYYYRVSKVYFCCKSNDTEGEAALPYSYFGWYYPNYPDNQDVYLPVSDGDVATHYVSAATYSLTPGTGNYDFAPGGGTAVSVQVNSFYYQGGYTNNDWFKKYVFHLKPKADADSADGEFENFEIEVDTKLASDGATTAYAPAVTGDSSSGNDTAANSAQDEEQAVALEPEDTFGDDTTEQTDVSEEVLESDDTEDGAGEDETDIDVQENVDESENIDAEDIDTQDDESVDVQAQDDEVSVSDSFADTLDNYDLIYVNGTLSADVAAAIAATDIPCIVNDSKANEATISEAFSDLMRNTAEDADGHYVNMYMYFFKNMFAGTDGDYNLVNTSFHENFNSNSNSDENLTYEAADRMHGFEEIIKYINSENQYRKLENNNSEQTNLDDGSDTSTQKIEPLGREISQARAIEYIINYKYQRSTLVKENLKVLEIMPYTGNEMLDKENVKKWVAGPDRKIKSVTACCSETAKEDDKAENMIDGDPNTRWHTLWNNEDGHSKNNPPYFTVTFDGAQDIRGFFYQNRTYQGNGSQNGVPVEYKAELYSDVNGQKLIDTVTGLTNITTDNQGKVTALQFGKTIRSVQSMKITFLRTLDSNGGNGNNAKYGSCSEFGVIYADSGTDVNIGATITPMTAAEFVGHIDDIGSEYDMVFIGDQKKNANSLITGSGEYRYAHVGDSKSIIANNNLAKMLGQLDTDYAQGSWSDGKLRYAPLSTYNEDGSGYFRGSGNDITKQQYNSLMDFVKSGYPVVLASGLVDGDKPNAKEVDSASYYYQFIKDALKYENVATNKELESGAKDLSFFMNLAKPVIKFDENGGKPKEPQRLGTAGTFKTPVDLSDTGYIDGELKYTFTVENDSDAAPATTTYDCKLYLDLNFDGNLSKKESQDKYMVVQDEDGNVLSQKDYGSGDMRYELKLGKKYTVTRKIPSDYYKLITWKLELTSNRNTYIHTSEIGYAKQQKPDGVAKQTINVLQLVPQDNSVNCSNPCTWTLADSSTFKNLIAGVQDFNINVISRNVTDINNGNVLDKNGQKTTFANLLDDQQMLIIGFQDVYQDISIDAVQEILKFIRSGKSVIFAHDTTSYINTDHQKIYGQIARDGYNSNGTVNSGGSIGLYDDSWLWNTARNENWGLSLNTILRSVVGMDRYGITSDATIGNQTVSELLKKGKPLSDGSVDFKTLLTLAGDVAYKNGDKSKSYAQTQGYTNAMLDGKTLGTGDTLTTRATKVNDGAITQYPYVIGDSITIAETHGQYYQLGMEQDRDINDQSDGMNDVVAWYCLTDNYYNNSPNDVRNNYYLYSKGNVIYTGAGHRRVQNDDEIKLFINTIVAAANVTAVKPEVNFVKTLNPAAETERTRFYMTDQTSWDSDEANTLEENMDFYINVRDYNMVSADLSQEELDKQEMTVQFYIEDENGSVEDGCPTTKNVSDITAQIGSLSGYGNIGTIESGSDGKFHLSQNSAYALKVSDIEQYLRNQNGSNGYKESCKLYAKVSSTVYLYGQEHTSTVWSSIDLKQRQLFELD